MLRRTGAFVVATAAIALLSAGCGPDGNSNANPPTPDTSIGAYPDPGCTAEHPRHVSINPTEWETLLLTCASSDGTSMHVDNLSSTVIDVTSSDLNADMAVEDQQPASLEEAAAEMAAPASCLVGTCSLPAGRTLDIDSDAELTLTFRVDDTKTLTAQAARGLVSVLTSRVPSPGGGFVQQVASCARDVQNLAQPAQWQEDVRNTITGSLDCSELVKKVLEEPQPDEAAVADDVVKAASRVGDGVWIDALSYDTVKILSHVR